MTAKVKKEAYASALPFENVRRYLEPGPSCLSSFGKGRRNVMTMGWHTVMEFSPSLVAA